MALTGDQAMALIHAKHQKIQEEIDKRLDLPNIIKKFKERKKGKSVMSKPITYESPSVYRENRKFFKDITFVPDKVKNNEKQLSLLINQNINRQDTIYVNNEILIASSGDESESNSQSDNDYLPQP